VQQRPRRIRGRILQLQLSVSFEGTSRAHWAELVVAGRSQISAGVWYRTPLDAYSQDVALVEYRSRSHNSAARFSRLSRGIQGHIELPPVASDRSLSRAMPPGQYFTVCYVPGGPNLEGHKANQTKLRCRSSMVVTLQGNGQQKSGLGRWVGNDGTCYAVATAKVRRANPSIGLSRSGRSDALLRKCPCHRGPRIRS
jgi:hypothetical protein